MVSRFGEPVSQVVSRSVKWRTRQLEGALLSQVVGREPEGESVTQLPRKKDDEPRGDSEPSENR